MAFDQARVLEVGSGDGRLAFRYARASAFLVGIDPDRSAPAAARGACPAPLRWNAVYVLSARVRE